MLIFYSYIQNCKNIDKSKNIIEIKKNSNIINMSRFINGGISKLKKNELLKLLYNLQNYKKEVYYINNKKIYPSNEQKKIIQSNINSNIRVIAGAGTGKTTTIVCRIRYLLDNFTIPTKILVLTFNLEAKKNIENMIYNIFNFNVAIEIKTIDSFCKKILYDYNFNLNFNYSLNELCTIGLDVMKKYGNIICSKYKYIFFDEFQDINSEQFEIIKIFYDNGCYITAIGDDFQNIYQFRGSDNYYLINFDKLFNKTITFQITTNYRNSINIINASNYSIKNNNENIKKEIIPISSNKGDIIFKFCKNENDKIKYILSKINMLVDNNKYSDIAILSRNSYNLKIIENIFEKEKIPYSSLITDDYGDKEHQYIKKNSIVLSSIHKSKGLEWKIVFIIGLSDIFFPSHNNLINIEEERRLFYVGITRAKYCLCFIACKEEIPITRFIYEIKDHIDLKIKNNSIKDIFSYKDNSITKNNYTIYNIIDKINNIQFKKLRKEDLIINNIKEYLLFNNNVIINSIIKKESYVIDFHLFCRCYFLRDLMIKDNQKLNDTDVENILYAIYLTENEKKIYNKYNLSYYFLTNKMPKISKKNNDKVQELINNIINKTKQMLSTDVLTNITINDLLKIAHSRISMFVYPKYFIKKLNESYIFFMNKEKLSQDITESIYFISLCKRIKNNRKKLVYHNVYDIFINNFNNIEKNIKEYIKKIKDSYNICKIPIHMIYNIDGRVINIFSEIDFIDQTRNTIYMVKFLDNEYKVEWLLYLLIQIMFLKGDEKYSKFYDIKYIFIINLVTGKLYKIAISENYNFLKLKDFCYNLILNKNISNNNNNSNSTKNEYLITKNIDNKNNKNNNEIICDYTHIELKKEEKIYEYMVLDIENNIKTQDIIQLSYIIFDSNNNEFERYDAYIKDRYVDAMTREITKITIDILNDKGICFKKVMKKFFYSLNKVKYLCGHYIHTDISKIKKNLDFYNITLSYDILQQIHIQDTYILYKNIYKEKNISLSKMYFNLFKKKMTNQHNSLYDVLYTKKCFLKLKELNNK